MKESLAWVSATLRRVLRALTTRGNMGIVALSFSLSQLSEVLLRVHKTCVYLSPPIQADSLAVQELQGFRVRDWKV